MWEISQVFCMGILLSLSVIDIHFRRIPVDILVMASIAALVYQGITRQADLWMAAGGAGVGILFLLVSKVTREGFGYGDSWANFSLGNISGAVGSAGCAGGDILPPRCGLFDLSDGKENV